MTPSEYHERLQSIIDARDTGTLTDEQVWEQVKLLVSDPPEIGYYERELAKPKIGVRPRNETND